MTGVLEFRTWLPTISPRVREMIAYSMRNWLASMLAPELRDALLKTIDAFAHFLHEGPRAAKMAVERQQEIAQLDPGLGQPQRRAWARINGALAEINVFLSHHPRLLNIKQPV